MHQSTLLPLLELECSRMGSSAIIKGYGYMIGNVGSVYVEFRNSFLDLKKERKKMHFN